MPKISEILNGMKTLLYQNITKVQNQKQNMQPKPTQHVHIARHPLHKAKTKPQRECKKGKYKRKVTTKPKVYNRFQIT